MKNQLQLAISSNGQITAIYSDELAELISEGSASIKRASHVEPEGSSWSAELVDGPTLGPFKLRQTALDAEIAYLEKVLFEG